MNTHRFPSLASDARPVQGGVPRGPILGVHVHAPLSHQKLRDRLVAVLAREEQRGAVILCPAVTQQQHRRLGRASVLQVVGETDAKDHGKRNGTPYKQVACQITKGKGRARVRDSRRGLFRS